MSWRCLAKPSHTTVVNLATRSLLEVGCLGLHPRLEVISFASDATTHATPARSVGASILAGRVQRLCVVGRRQGGGKWWERNDDDDWWIKLEILPQRVWAKKRIIFSKDDLA